MTKQRADVGRRHVWVRKKHGHESPLANSFFVLPLLVYIDCCLLLADVELLPAMGREPHAGAGAHGAHGMHGMHGAAGASPAPEVLVSNPYRHLGHADAFVMMCVVPAAAAVVNVLLMCGVEWATDFELNALDFIAYKLNQFGTLTGLQEKVNRLRKLDQVKASNYYQDLRSDLGKCLLVFAAQTLYHKVN